VKREKEREKMKEILLLLEQYYVKCAEELDYKNAAKALRAIEELDID
jgi:hypothetical protein